MCCEWVIMGDIPIEAGRLAVLPDRCQDRHLRFRRMDGALWWRERGQSAGSPPSRRESENSCREMRRRSHTGAISRSML